MRACGLPRGHGICREVRCKVEGLGYLAFFDDESASSTYGERVELRPDCGQSLAIHIRLPKTP
jgi:hypothetical protein